jgi:hypothetical protein
MENFLSDNLVILEEKAKIWGISKKKRAYLQISCKKISKETYFLSVQIISGNIVPKFHSFSHLCP